MRPPSNNTVLRCLVVSTLPLACGRNEPPPVVPVASACTDRSVGSAERPWRVVQAPTFTFCVPPHWQPADGRSYAAATTWAVDRDTLGWYYARALVPRGEVIIRLTEPDGHVRDCSAVPQLWTETVGGAAAELSHAWCGPGRHLTAAVWRTPVLYFDGKAYGGRVAAEQLAVIRTVRFAVAPNGRRDP